MSRVDLQTILRCPQDRSSLTAAGDDVIAQINADIRSRSLRNAGGRLLEKPIDGGFIRAAGDLLYPVVDQIPVLLADEAIKVNDE